VTPLSPSIGNGEAVTRWNIIAIEAININGASMHVYYCGFSYRYAGSGSVSRRVMPAISLVLPMNRTDITRVAAMEQSSLFGVTEAFHLLFHAYHAP
jgi:hypothetical protein